MPAPNRLFTGRAKELDALHTTLQTGNAAPTPTLAALHGIGGVGKTQTAAQYVHLHGAEYMVVAWVRGDTPAEFKAQLAGLATVFDSSLIIQHDQNAMFEAAQQWLNTHGDWLLVIDNAERLPDLNVLLPQNASGRILLITRERVPPRMADTIEIHHLDAVTGATLLLRCAGTLKPDQELDAVDATVQADAKAVSAELGGLALALDQAGAYMHERALPPATYLDFYRERRQRLHKDYKSRDHASVSVTFDLALEQVKQIPEHGPAAVELAYLCAFLAPDAIPDEVFLIDPTVLPDVLAPFAHDEIAFADVCEAATHYALLRRETEPPGLWMHRLAQEVVRDSLDKDMQHQMRQQVVRAVSAAFPWPEYPVWRLCERLLPHALLCYAYVTTHDLRTLEATGLLNNTARYLHKRARYAEAEPLYVEALAIARKVQGAQHTDVAPILNNLAVLYRHAGRYEDAVPLLKEALTIDRSTIGKAHPDYATRLDNLAGVYYLQRRFNEAEPLYKQALNITRRALGKRHLEVAKRLNNLASVYADTQRYAEAEPLLVEALAIDRETIGEAHPDHATRLLNLGRLHVQWGHLDDAEPMLMKALILHEHSLGLQHPNVAFCYSWLGELRYRQDDRMMAAHYCRQALAIWEGIFGPNHPDTVNAREWLDKVQRELAEKGG